MNGPRKEEEDIIMSMFHGMWQNRCLAVIVGLNIPELLCNADQPSTHIDDLANRAGCCSSEQLYPIMRVLAQWGIGTEHPDTKCFSKNRAMELLRRDQGSSLGSLLAYFCSDEKWQAMLALPQAVKTGVAAFPLEHGMTHLEYMSKAKSLAYDPTKTRIGSSKHDLGSQQRREEYANTYEDAMQYISYLHHHQPTPCSSTVYNAYPWSSCRRLMDIGGSSGAFLASILQLPGCEHVEGIMVDLPEVIDKTRPLLPEYGAAAERMKLLEHDCFKPFPDDTPKADIIMCKNFFVCFTEEESVKMMVNIRRAFPPEGGRFVVIGPRGAPEAGDTEHNIAGNGLQLGFLNIHAFSIGGHYRSRTEWIALLKLIGSRSGFKFSDVYVAANGNTNIYEMVTV